MRWGQLVIVINCRLWLTFRRGLRLHQDCKRRGGGGGVWGVELSLLQMRLVMENPFSRPHGGEERVEHALSFEEESRRAWCGCCCVIVRWCVLWRQCYIV